ncbi:hypothetical protein Tco_0592739 [Tanacetum coccineum]
MEDSFSVLLYGEHKAQAQAELFVVTRALRLNPERCLMDISSPLIWSRRSWQFALCMLEGVDVRSRAIKVSVVVTPALGSMYSLVFFTWAQTVNWSPLKCILSKPRDTNLDATSTNKDDENSRASFSQAGENDADA